MALCYFGYRYTQVIFRAPAGRGWERGRGSPCFEKKKKKNDNKTKQKTFSYKKYLCWNKNIRLADLSKHLNLLGVRQLDPISDKIALGCRLPRFKTSQDKYSVVHTTMPNGGFLY